MWWISGESAPNDVLYTLYIFVSCTFLFLYSNFSIVNVFTMAFVTITKDKKNVKFKSRGPYFLSRTSVEWFYSVSRIQENVSDPTEVQMAMNPF